MLNFCNIKTKQVCLTYFFPCLFVSIFSDLFLKLPTGVLILHLVCTIFQQFEWSQYRSRYFLFLRHDLLSIRVDHHHFSWICKILRLKQPIQYCQPESQKGGKYGKYFEREYRQKLLEGDVFSKISDHFRHKTWHERPLRYQYKFHSFIHLSNKWMDEGINKWMNETCTGIEDFFHVTMFSQINGHFLIIHKIFHIYKRKNLVHFVNYTTFGPF